MLALLASILLLETLPQSSSNDASAWFYQSVNLRNLHHPLKSYSTSLSTTLDSANNNILRKSVDATNPSDFQWFQEIYYPNLKCEGAPYRMFQFALGDCFKDSSHTSFMFALTPDATQLISSAYSDDHCGMMSHNESDGFEGSVYEGPDSISKCNSNPPNTQTTGSDFPTSVRTFAYKTPLSQLTYPASGQISR